MRLEKKKSLNKFSFSSPFFYFGEREREGETERATEESCKKKKPQTNNNKMNRKYPDDCLDDVLLAINSFKDVMTSMAPNEEGLNECVCVCVFLLFFYFGANWERERTNPREL